MGAAVAAQHPCVSNVIKKNNETKKNNKVCFV